ncbi:MAG: hypothetical protein K8S98_19005 [Planctomycetes bacterium]|nr:hypothetical protein [Planctomycetota bacterium]
MIPAFRIASRSSILLLSTLLAGVAFAQSPQRDAPRPRPKSATDAVAGTLGGPADETFRGPGANFVQASWTTRTSFVGQNDPFALVMPALPAGATEVVSYASWNFLDDSGTIGTDTIDINGVAVTGGWIGDESPGLCSPKAFLDTWVANVTGLVNHGGANIVDDVCDKAIYTDPTALGSGLTILTVYQFTLGPDREVDLWAGVSTTTSVASGDIDMPFNLTTSWDYLDLRFFVNAIGGDPVDTDSFRINGVDVSGSLAGTNAVNDAWTGLLGPAVDYDLYDAADGDISANLSAGATGFVASTFTGTDCIGHTFAAASHQVECGDVVSYCTSKVNSLGCAPIVTTTGTPSVGSGLPFKIRGSNFRNHKNGMLFYGYGKLEVPFQGGYLCVKGPLKRTPVQDSAGNTGTNDCSGTYAYDFNALIRAGTDANLVVGAKIFAQYWARDLGDPFGISMSDAVGFDICP